MKPVVGAFGAWICTAISAFAMLILSIIGLLFHTNHHMMMGLEDDPTDNVAVAHTVFITVAVYGVFFVFCGSQAWLHQRQSRRGQISLR